MSGLFPGVCNSQNVDQNGQPLAGAVLTVYNGGTLQLASVYQDIGLAVAAQNPMTADDTGRLPFFYVADGVYRVRLVSASGILIYDYPQCSSIGASSSGGGGSGVDPTTIFSTGDILWQDNSGIRTGWVRNNGLTIGSGLSGASERANSDCQNLFQWLWNNKTNVSCPVVGGRGVSAAADWAANKQITMPDYRGLGPAGADGMGNVRANILPDGNVTSEITGAADTGDTVGAYGGEANHALIVNEMAAHSHGVTDPGHSHGVTDPGHVHGVTDPGHSHGVSDPTHNHVSQDGGAFVTIINRGSEVAGGNDANSGGAIASNSTGISIQVSDTGVSIQTHATNVTINTGTTGITTQSVGGGAAHNNMQPFVIGTWYRKL